MAGILDFLNTPAGMGLLSGVASYAANARRGTPVNNIGRGLLGGAVGYSKAQEDLQNQEQQKFLNEYRNIQMEKARQEIDMFKGQQQWRQGLPQVLEKAQPKVEQFQPDDPFNQGSSAFGELYGGPKSGEQVSGQMYNVQPGNQKALQDYMRDPNSPFADKIMERQLFPKSPEYKTVGNTMVKVGDEGVTPVFTAPDKDRPVFQVRDGRNIVSINPNITEQQAVEMGLPYKKGAGAVVGTGEMDKPAVIGSGGTPYYQFIGTPQGIVRANARTGELSLGNVNGVPIMKSADSPALQGQLSGAKEAGKGAGEFNMKQFEAAQNAVPIISKVDQQIALIDKGNIVTGFGAEFRTDIERAKALLGSKAAQGKVTDTEILESMMGSDVFGMISSLGIGAKGLDTPAEREFMRSVLTGTKALNKETLKQMAQIRRNIAERAVDKWNTRVNSGELDQFFTSTGFPKQTIDIPGKPTSFRVTAPNGKVYTFPNQQAADNFKKQIGAQ